MADYYPLISRAVAALDPNTPDTRAAIYARARQALMAQLRSVDPPLPMAIIAREEAALDETVKRIEVETLSRGTGTGAEAAVTEPTAHPIEPAAARVPSPPPAPAQSTPPLPPLPSAPPATDEEDLLANLPPPAPAPRRQVIDDKRPPTELAPISERPSLAAKARPKLPERDPRKRGRNPLFIPLVVLGSLVVAGVAAYAIANRNRPTDIAVRLPPPAAGTAAPAPAQDGQKIGERIPSEAGETPPARPAEPPRAPAPPPPTAVQPPAGGSTVLPLPVAHRLILIEQTGPEPQDVSARQGAIIWRVDSADTGQGRPLQTVIRGSIEVPEVMLRGEIRLRRNLDPSFPASHTLEIAFTPLPGNTTGAVQGVSKLELRQFDNQPGTPLDSLGVPVGENLFLFGLNNAEAARQRNMDMLLNRDWFYFEVRFANDKLGAFLFEKGATGKQVFEEAIRRW
jgi:hypothetical protein